MALRGLKFISESQLTIGLFKSVTTVQILQRYRMASKLYCNAEVFILLNKTL